MRLRFRSAPLLLLLAGFSIAAFSLTFSHLAGSFGGPGVEDGTGAVARFHSDAAVAVDSAGNVYVADTANHTIREISSSGVVTTLAGLAETPGFFNGRGAHARFNMPQGITFDPVSGNIYVSDTNNHAIRKISPTGVVATVAYSITDPLGLTLDASGNIYVADPSCHCIRQVSGGTVTTLAGTGSPGNVNDTGTLASFNTPQDVVYDATTSALYVADTGNNVIRKITLPGAVVSTYAGTMNTPGHVDGSPGRMFSPRGITVDATGTFYVADAADDSIRSISAGTLGSVAGLPTYPGPTDGSGTAAQFDTPGGIAVIGSKVYVADSHNHTVRLIVLGGANSVTTLAGLANAAGFVNGVGAAARFNNPNGLAYYPGPAGVGFAYVADTNNNAIRRAGIDGVVTTLAGGTYGYQNGNGSNAWFRGPTGVAFSFSTLGVYVADTGNHCIRFIDSLGNTTLFAGQPGSPGSRNGDRLTAASFNSPQAVALNPSQSALYVADTGNFMIRKIVLSTGAVGTLAGSGVYGHVDANGTFASFGPIHSLMVDSGDNVYVAESQQGTIRKITPSGDVTTLAGSPSILPAVDGTGLAARFGYPGPSAIAGAWYGTGSLVADQYAQLIRTFDTSTLVVGTAGGRVNVSGTSDGTGTFARFNLPQSLDGFASINNFVISEGNTIRLAGPEIPDRAVIDSPTGMIGTARQLDMAPQTATSWTWSIIRQPAGSTATLSSTIVRNPTFTPDVPDLYVFRCVAATATGTSISTVVLQANGPPASLSFGYPAPYPTTSGSPFSIFLAAMDTDGNVADGYSGTVHFTSSVGGSTLPGDYTFNASDHGAHTFSATYLQSGSIIATDTVTSSLVSGAFVPVLPLAPTAFSATAPDTTQVSLSWTGSASPVDHYEITRASSGGAYTDTFTTASTTYTDRAVSAGASYVYRVRAIGAYGEQSLYAAPDVASTIVFTDDPAVAGTTLVNAVHFTELLDAVNALRFTAGLAPMSLSSTPAAGLLVKTSTIQELRTGLDQARAVFAGLPAMSYTDPTLTTDTTMIKAAHVQEIRAGVK